MATHEQLPSTSSRPLLDPTTTTQTQSSKDVAPKTALNYHSAEATSTSSTIHIGSRKSVLALIQTNLVHDA
jgi:hydroxymethylbilane synthase